jgi:uncharacterized membrane protein (UPF0136 family)
LLIEEAGDRPGTLAATLPFGGMTLLEYQVRLLAGAGIEHVLVAVARITPQLLAAVAGAERRGVRVEVVRSAEEASEKVDPAARVIVLADGLVTTDPVIDRMVAEGAEALLVTDDPASPSAIERLDMRDSWAGIARVTGVQLGEIAQMPADYDFQSALLRVAVQAGAEHIMLHPGWASRGHVVELTEAALATRSNAVLAALTERRTSWADRWVFNRFSRLVLPELTGRGIKAWTLLAGGVLLGVTSLGAIAANWEGIGLLVSLLAVAVLATSATWAALLGETRRTQGIEIGITALFGLATVSVGASRFLTTHDWTPVVLALALVAFQLLAERIKARHRRWWASPSAHLLLLTPFALAGYAEAGLAILAIYAFSTIFAAVETTREKA